MTHDHQPKNQPDNRPTPPTTGSAVIPPSGHVDLARVLAIYEDHIARLQEEAGSWRSTAERLKAEKAVLSARVDTLTIAMRNARDCAAGGNAKKSTAEMLRFLADYAVGGWAQSGMPTKNDILDRASRLDAADRMMRAALYPED